MITTTRIALSSLVLIFGLTLTTTSLAATEGDDVGDAGTTPANSNAPLSHAAEAEADAEAVADAGAVAAPTPGAAVPPSPAPPPPSSSQAAFAADPLTDGVLILGAAGFAGLLDLINGTGELRPQQISPTFNRSDLLSIDRGAVNQTIDTSARTVSNFGLIAACAYAALDPIFSGIREKSVQAGLVDAVIYAESISFTWGLTNLAKMAVRRPRPQAYIDAEAHKGDPNYSNSDTDSSVSFFSGHASITAAISASATYLAFARSPSGSARPWITMGVGTALTTVVSIERVRGGAHFPTDVIAGAIAGAGVGVITAHLHRVADASKDRRVWIGFGPERGGASGQVGAAF